MCVCVCECVCVCVCVCVERGGKRARNKKRGKKGVYAISQTSGFIKQQLWIETKVYYCH